jgi:hypothetical protein
VSIPAQRSSLQQATQTLQAKGALTAEQASQIEKAAGAGTLDPAQQTRLTSLAEQSDRYDSQALLAQAAQCIPQPAVEQSVRISPLLARLGHAKPDMEPLLKDVLANFDALANAGGSGTVFGLEDVRAILAKPDTFPKTIVDIARRAAAQDHIFDLADWTYPGSGNMVHDRTDQKCEFERALNIVQDRKGLTDAVTYLVNNYDKASSNDPWPFVLEKADFQAEVARLEVGNPNERKMAEALKKTYAQGPGVPGPVDVFTLLANASGNNSSTDAQFATRAGLKLFKDVINSKNPERLTQKAVDGRPNRQLLAEQLAANFDAMRQASARDNLVFVGPADVKAILDKPASFTPEVVSLARTLSRNLDMLDLASWVEYAGNNGRAGNDRIATGEQFSVVASLMKEAPAFTAALDHVIGMLGNGWTGTGMQTLDKPTLQKEIERLKAGTPSEQAVATTLQTSWGNNWSNLGQLMMAACGNNDPANMTLTREGLTRLRNLINAPMPGSRPATAEQDTVQRADVKNTSA